MCVTCGCEQTDGHSHVHDHPGHAYMARRDSMSGARSAEEARRVRVERDILSRNDAYAEDNRKRLGERGVFALNLLSSPGSGKTTLLVKTIEKLRGTAAVAVIEGDQQTRIDAERIEGAGARAVQINTGKGCHLDAKRVGQALDEVLPDTPDEMPLLVIENVGNLVCPASFDLGEACKVVILSVTEGDDKPLKYPDIFLAARLMLISKCDLLPYVPFNVAQAVDYARRVNPDIEVLQVSALSGEGMDAWCAWLMAGRVSAAMARNTTSPASIRRDGTGRRYVPV